MNMGDENTSQNNNAFANADLGYSRGYRDAIRDLIELRREQFALAMEREDSGGGFLYYFAVLIIVFVIARVLLCDDFMDAK